MLRYGALALCLVLTDYLKRPEDHINLRILQTNDFRNPPCLGPWRQNVGALCLCLDGFLEPYIWTSTWDFLHCSGILACTRSENDSCKDHKHENNNSKSNEQSVSSNSLKKKKTQKNRYKYYNNQNNSHTTITTAATAKATATTRTETASTATTTAKAIAIFMIRCVYIYICTYLFTYIYIYIHEHFNASDRRTKLPAPMRTWKTGLHMLQKRT